MMQTRRLIAVLFAILLALAVGACSITPAAKTPSDELAPNHHACDGDRGSAIAAWKKLRRTYPLHIQGVAESEPFQSGCRAVIVAEPAAHVTVAAMRSVAPDLLRAATTHRHRIGVDGWTEDVMFLVPPASSMAINDIVGALHVKLFGTSYQAERIDWSPPRRAASLDIRIDAKEVHALVMGEEERFIPIWGGPPTTAQDIARAGSSMVYHSERPGVILWAIPQNLGIDQLRVEARQFAVDSDVILGGMLLRSTAFIVGRERVVPFSILPPLRAETLAMLAAAKPGQLAQSYERQLLVSGRHTDTKEWAPILLSPDLRDTEFGSLLNIADQLLKGWSNNGTTHYANFNYPRPAAWGFRKPLGELVPGDLTYNFNTIDHAKGLRSSDRIIIAFACTAALPATYLSGGRKLANYERTGHDFFAGESDPILARVVQYASLYQIFKTYMLTAEVPSVSENSVAKKLLENETKQLLQAILDGDPQRQQRVAQATITKTLRGHQLHGGPKARRALHQDVKAYLQNVRSDLKSAVGTDDNRLAKLARQLSSPRDTPNATPSWTPTVRPLKLKYVIESSRDTLTAVTVVLNATPVLQRFVDLSETKRRYQQTWHPDKRRRIHTPSVVVSWNSGSMSDATGGHNIVSGVVAKEVRGEADFHSSRAQLAAAKRSNLKQEKRSQTTAKRGAELTQAATQDKQRRAGWRQHPAVRDRSASKPPANLDVAIMKLGDGYIVTTARGSNHAGGLGEALEIAANIASRSNGQHLSIAMHSLSPAELRLFALSLRNRMNAQQRGMLRTFQTTHRDIRNALRELGKPTSFSSIQNTPAKVTQLSNGMVRVELTLKLTSTEGEHVVNVTLYADHAPQNIEQVITKKIHALEGKSDVAMQQVAEQCAAAIGEAGVTMNIDIREVAQRKATEKRRLRKQEYVRDRNARHAG